MPKKFCLVSHPEKCTCTEGSISWTKLTCGDCGGKEVPYRYGMDWDLCRQCNGRGFINVCACGHTVKRPDKAESGCAVATAVLGTELHPDLKLLRQYRDRLVAAGGAGRWLSAYYNTITLPVADLVRSNSFDGS